MTVLCNCEEVSKDEIRGALRKGARTFDDLKRLTRCGMGPCQAKTCFYAIADFVYQEAGIPLEEFPPMRARAPLHPMRISSLVPSHEEVPLMSLLELIGEEDE